MSLMFKKSDINFNNFEFKEGDIIKVRFYDQYKFINIFEGKCLLKRKTDENMFVTLQNRNKGIYFSFFLNSPLLVALFKKN